MNIEILHRQIQAVPADAIIVNLFEGLETPGGATGAVDTALGASDGVPGDGAISNVLGLGDFKGELHETAVIYTHGLIPAPRVILTGLGPADEFDVEAAREASAAAIRKARDLGCKRVATIAHGSGIGGLDPADAAAATVEGALLGAYQFRQHRSGEGAGKAIETLLLVEYDTKKIDDIRAGATRGRIMAESINLARDWTNLAPNALTPPDFAQRAQAMAAQTGLRCEVLHEDAIRALGMGGVIGVSQGSIHPPRFVVLEHAPVGHTDDPPLVFAGKGVTFDTGGYSIKTNEGMSTMKGDMAGAAAVIAALGAIARLGLRRRVIGLAPMVENMISDAAIKPGDVLKMMNGMTVEIANTDAEGRLILADAIEYAKRFGPEVIIDIATLTGTSSTAMGPGIAATLMDNDARWADRILDAADAAAERLWRMPLYPEHGERIRGDVADIKNTGGPRGGLGSSAWFLKRFAESRPKQTWAHIDMAGMNFDIENRGTRVKSASGYGVRTFVTLAAAQD
jgi:leucyl aminopeptidase